MRALVPVLFALLFLAPAFAGCISSGDELLGSSDVPAVTKWSPAERLNLSALSKPVFGMLPKMADYVTVQVDGVKLYTEAYLPDGEGPWPTILVMSPYFNHGVDGDIDPMATFRDAYVPRGYAVVLADVRGTGYSEGCMNMMGAKEQQDGYDIVEWVAAQEWSDGKIGMYGVSYVGTTPSAAAIMAPPSLVTIVPVAGVTNQWRNMYQNGVPYFFRFYPLTYEIIEGTPPPTDISRGPEWALNVAAAGCEQEEMIEHVSPGTYEKGVYDDYWAERNFTTRAGNVKASVFYVQGFQDRAVNPMEAVHWFNDIQSPKKAWLGQWFHSVADRDDWENGLLAWFDHWLKGKDTGIMDGPVVEVFTNVGTVRGADHWPATAAEATPVRLHLAPGALQADAPADGAGSYRFGPPRGFDDVTGLSFVSEPLADPLHIGGSAVMHLEASSDRPHTYFLFSWYDIDKGDQWTEIAEGWMNAHLRDGFDRSTPLEPGVPASFQFAFEPREYVIREGHRVGLRVMEWDGRVMPIGEASTMNTILFGEAGSFLEIPGLVDPVTRPVG